MISIQQVTKRFGRAIAVNAVSLDIAPGDSVALWGTNGAGKTTLLRSVLGLLSFRGRILVGGRDVRRAGKSARQLIGYVPQEIGFYDDLFVDEAVRFFARLKAIWRFDVRVTLERVGLDGHGQKRIRELSGGMKQRLALAIALLGDPPVLLLDEVTASLDAVGREEFVHLLEGLSGSGRTLLFASHRLDEVASLARHVARLESGRLTEWTTCAAFLGQVGHCDHLHLIVEPGARQHALHSLSAGGFNPRLNGVGLIVPVLPDHKAAPFRVLADARISVQDFELITASRAAALHADSQGELR